MNLWHCMIAKQNELTSLLSLTKGVYSFAQHVFADLARKDEKRGFSWMCWLLEEMKQRSWRLYNKQLNETQCLLLKMRWDARNSLTSETLFPCISIDWFLSAPPVPSSFFKSCKSPSNSAPPNPTCEMIVTSLPARPFFCSRIWGSRVVFWAGWLDSPWHLHLRRNLPQVMHRLLPEVV